MESEAARLIAIGDVHGCAHALDCLVDAIRPTERDHLVFLGDLIDQGRDSRDVLARVLELRARLPVSLIEGNHEEMLLAARDSEKALRYWETCGGINTLNSYRFGGGLKDIPDEHWALVESCVPYLETDAFIFTHANYTPGLPMKVQPSHQLRWALFDPEEMQPHRSGKRAFVGHTEQRSGEICDLGFVACVDTACWRSGWLTAIEVASGQTWQASRWGMLREPDEASQRTRLAGVLQPSASITL